MIETEVDSDEEDEPKSLAFGNMLEWLKMKIERLNKNQSKIKQKNADLF